MIKRAFRDSKGREFFPGERVIINIHGSYFPQNSQGEIIKVFLTNDSEPIALVNVENLSAARKDNLFFLSDLEHVNIDTQTTDIEQEVDEREKRQIIKPAPIAAEKVYKTRRLIKR